ncbi:MAG TPA: hypothetical protein VFV38_37745 [Ktedonobacteraceae bacterium]|nr:hypothetical protein [Ktedonobacteraceae bacterium]
MQKLQQLTQSHLCVVVLDQNTHNPIARMPIYAEVSIFSELPRYQLTDQDLGQTGTSGTFFRDPVLGPMLRSTLVQWIDETVFRQLSDTREQFFGAIITALNNVKGLKDRSESETRLIVETSVLKAMELLNIPRSEQQRNAFVSAFPLGFLATDHAGYASFDLTRVPKSLLGPTSGEYGAKRQYAFSLYPMGKEGARYDALEQKRFTSDAVFAKLVIEQPLFTPDLKILSLPSMQRPSLIDWYFSPGSFAAHPSFLIGADGCENLLPAQLALQEFTFRQVVRLKDTPPEILLPAGYRFGYVDEYRASWYSLGHALGEIQYSLPLAPGESVKLAVIDWSWESTTQRTEDTKMTEQLLHETHRDRSITETVNAALQEWQRGGSVMGGVAGSYKGGGFGVSAALGGAYTTSSGSRDLAVENIQKLNDSFAQASSSQRELYSTVVIQAREEEKESIQTRTFTNYNHGHTLTILYYEVLRHFKVVVEWTRRRPVVLVKFTRIGTFVYDDILKYRFLFENNLLDQGVKPGFDALEHLANIRNDRLVHGLSATSDIPFPIPAAESDLVFDLFEFGMLTTQALDNDSSVTLRLSAVMAGGDFIDLGVEGIPHDHNFNTGSHFRNDNEITWFIAYPDRPVRYGELLGFAINTQNHIWQMSELGINAFVGRNKLVLRTLGDLKPLVDSSEHRLFFGVSRAGSDRDDQGNNTITDIRLPAPPLPAPPTILSPEHSLSADENYAIKKLRDHVNQFPDYYNRLILLNRDANAIATEFETVPWSGGDYLIDHVEPYPLEIFGDYIAYPFTDPVPEEQTLITDQMDTSAEKLITLPTRGVFAEGKLGHCNISEEIDNTRFWKWEEHPVPIQAPDINPVTAVTPQPQPTTISPTPFPTSLVNIVSPTPAPDPVGLAAALKVLGTPNIFRDMSGVQEVSQLLQKLSGDATGLANSNGTSGSSSTSGGQTSGPGSTGGSLNSNASGVARPDPNTQHDQLQVLRNAQQQGDITEAQKNQLAQDYLQNVVSPATATPLSPTAVTDAFADYASKVSFTDGLSLAYFFTGTTGKEFIDWFNGTCANRDAWNGRALGSSDAVKQRFTTIWDHIPDMFGTPNISLVQFTCLMSIFINEVGTDLLPISELMGRPGHPGLAYAFDSISGVKVSYNQAPSLTALALFNDANFIAAHGSLALAPTLKNTTDGRWGSSQYPQADYSTSLDPNITGFIQEADFYKFRGRGFIQTTWRTGYLRVIQFVQSYTGTDAKILNFQSQWAGQSANVIATKSANADWDDLYQHTNFIIPCVAVRLHNESANSYLSLATDAATLNGTSSGSIYNVGKRVSGGDTYAALFKRRVIQIFNALGNGQQGITI